MGSVTSGLDNSIKEGINIINGPNGLFTLIRDSQNNVVQAYQHTVDGVKTIYTDTERNFFRTVNNTQQHLANNFRSTQKDVVTLVDDQLDSTQFLFRDMLHKFYDTIQWSATLSFIFVIVVTLLFGEHIVKEIITPIIKNGVKISFS
jgi:hypothetical protein